MSTPIDFLNEVNKNYKTELVLGQDKTKSMKKKRFSTGVFHLDLQIGGGWLYGHNQEIAGPESAGKTLLAIKAMQSIANYCRCRKTLASCDCGKKEPSKTLYVDTEGTFDIDWAQTCGVNMELVYYVRPQYGEQASDIINKAILENVFDLIILDSLDSLLPLKSIEGSIEDGQRMAARAALVGDSLRKWNMSRLQLAKEDSPALITINQLREKPTIYGNPWYMPGGNAQKFYHDIILWLTKSKSEDDSASGETGKMLLGGKTEKNKTFKPKMEFAFYLALENSDLYKKGQIQNIEQLFDLGKKYNLIIKDKGWNFNNEVVAPNGEEFQALLKSSGKGPKLWRSILNHVCGYSNISENVLG